ncbi:hypothetical protein GFH48_09290 [Streptomyces fagopyri]|uniref:Helix-turn-helix domain-containing protein n=1 Tax=Streptomyces fagopyri TaxID=2662397 RepID=A0A5Q0L9D6_9ACTN|nr:helix-turn-helix domain-containing protein [Streptomyces fagopyri]QFZ73424.1 hypothetical protein GFH48_09290 [Streptomyces fagopyri]
MTTETVSQWRGRFLKGRLDGLGDAPRPGRERTVTDERVAESVRMTLEAKPRNATHWSTRSMARGWASRSRRSDCRSRRTYPAGWTGPSRCCR